ncbi:hypothetical protein J5690_07725 [bacterium]|nr:hypothetical protein [bacterium]
MWNKLGFFLSLNHEEIYENWMINYRGGFLRRGLGGEIILHLASLFGVSHIVVVNILTFVIWVILISFFITKFVQKQYPLFILAMPFCLGETIFADPSYFLRKDSLSILIFILMLTLFFKKKSLPHSLLFLFLNSLFILGILIHEEIFFFSFPILFISYWHRNKSFCKTLLFFTPPAAAFIYCCMNIQDQQIVTEMLARTPEIKNPASNALLYIPLSEYFSRVWTMVNDPSLLATGLYSAYIFIFIYFSCLNFDKIKINLTSLSQIDQNFLFCILLLQFLSLFPIFCSAWDWGRWIFLWTASSFAYFLIVDENPFGEKIVSKVNVILTSKWLQKAGNNQIFVFCIMTLIGVQYQIPLEIEFFTRTPIYSVLKVVSKTILHLKDLIL